MAKQQVFFDMNGSSLINVIGSGIYRPEHEFKAIKLERDCLAAKVNELAAFIKDQSIPNLLVSDNDYPQCLGIKSAITDAEELIKSIPENPLNDLKENIILDFCNSISSDWPTSIAESLLADAKDYLKK